MYNELIVFLIIIQVILFSYKQGSSSGSSYVIISMTINNTTERQVVISDISLKATTR